MCVLTVCNDHSDPSWASINRGVLLCNDCCSVHRSLGRHVSHIRSLQAPNWPPVLKEVRSLCAGGWGLLALQWRGDFREISSSIMRFANIAINLILVLLFCLSDVYTPIHRLLCNYTHTPLTHPTHHSHTPHTPHTHSTHTPLTHTPHTHITQTVFTMVKKGSNSLWEHLLNDSSHHQKIKVKKPSSKDPREKQNANRHDFIVCKYKNLQFLPRTSIKDHINSLEDLSKVCA